MALATGEVKRDCKTCDARLREIRGCVLPAKVAQFVHADGEEIRRCPLRVVDRAAMAAVAAHGYLQAGLLPEPGGVLDQPAAFLRAMEQVSVLTARAYEDRKNG